MLCRQRNKSRGFGFVTFTEASAAKQVCEKGERGELELNGRRLDVKFAVSRGNLAMQRAAVELDVADANRPMKCFVAGLPLTVDDAALRQYWETVGAVEDASVQLDRTTGEPLLHFWFS